MRALFLIPGNGSTQLQAFPAVEAVANQLQAQIHVVCSPSQRDLWSLHPAQVRVIPFNYEAASLADWANLLGSIREPDFQLCFNRARGRQVDLMLSMSHIPSRIATDGFSATERVQEIGDIWPNQAWQSWLQPIGVQLDAESFRLPIPKAELVAVAADLPPGDGPMLMLGREGGSDDWPSELWEKLPERIRGSLPTLRTISDLEGSFHQRAARMASADVVLASAPVSIDLALLLGLPVVALGRATTQLPDRQGVRGLGQPNQLTTLRSDEVLSALGLA